jgi:hypothetical protein
MRVAECAYAVSPEEGFDADAIVITVRSASAGRVEVWYAGAVAGAAHIGEAHGEARFTFVHQGGHQEAGAFAVHVENGHAEATVFIGKRPVTDCERKAGDILTELINSSQPLPGIGELLRLQRTLRQ